MQRHYLHLEKKEPRKSQDCVMRWLLMRTNRSCAPGEVRRARTHMAPRDRRKAVLNCTTASQKRERSGRTIIYEHARVMSTGTIVSRGVARGQWKWDGFVVGDYDAWANLVEPQVSLR